ncbi:protein TolR [methanotrophic endosymbiont of Bathymodiolus puteoserpentis (Logatchev)]|uniref:protein TolR n=1 Tax=methanotrophic endosymbiont of Bathymodiolus puteoserpentis (Logatchev) TaxID=343235 RepID=UPI0013CB2B59|nr:protein TolR [methanotrophic endosymbiont of Bathymodiolus puteoserpentis (Logatchev)]SHE22387.1 Tol biopolymer transport system, TolR protein [methanotrophic endosymbiont of Bathymodiolus puteoserpentis (Logatchev)]
MARRNVRRKPMAEINVVPYIDVTLVLLIIFMITAPLIQSGVDVDLPQANSQQVDQDNAPTPVIITIDKSGQYFIDLGNGSDEQPVSASEVLLLTAAVRKNKPKTQVYIRGDKQVAYGKVVTVMAALKNAGVPNVGLMTENFAQ